MYLAIDMNTSRRIGCIPPKVSLTLKLFLAEAGECAGPITIVLQENYHTIRLPNLPWQLCTGGC